jgi:ComF family protein
VPDPSQEIAAFGEPAPGTPARRRIGLPSLCEVCRSWSGDRLCANCIARFAPAVPRCTRCALRLPAAIPLCGGCLRDPPPFEHTVCVADYAFPWAGLVARFKFHGHAELAGMLARRIAAVLDTAPVPRPALVTPVPLSHARLAERGYNQAWELARRVARHVDVPARADLLLRPLDTPHQAELTRAQRLANLRAAFMVDPRQRSRLEGLRVALVDDVLTTGATAREAAHALLRAGAAAVDIWVLARTPDA